MWKEICGLIGSGTHLVLYQAFKEVGGVAHTHSPAATSWAQARKKIPCFGTSHADYLRGPAGTKALKPEEIRRLRIEHGLAIARCVGKRDPLHLPGVLVGARAVCWGKRRRTRPTTR